MALQNKLKAFVRFDGSGRVIPSSLILQKSKPKVGNWKEINATQCCNDITSTTTTSSTSTSTTTSTSSSTTTTTTTSSYYYYLTNQYLCPDCGTVVGSNVVIKTTNPSLVAGNFVIWTSGGNFFNFEILSSTTYNEMAQLVDGSSFPSCTCP